MRVGAAVRAYGLPVAGGVLAALAVAGLAVLVGCYWHDPERFNHEA